MGWKEHDHPRDVRGRFGSGSAAPKHSQPQGGSASSISRALSGAAAVHNRMKADTNGGGGKPGKSWPAKPPKAPKPPKASKPTPKAKPVAKPAWPQPDKKTKPKADAAAAKPGSRKPPKPATGKTSGPPTKASRPATPGVPPKAQPYHRNLDGIEDLANSVENGFPPRDRRTLTGGESATTELLTLKDGRRVVHKTGVADGLDDSYAAEQASSLMARALGLPAPRVYRNDDNSVYMDYVDNAITATELQETQPHEWETRSRAMLDHDDANLIGLLDALTSNPDRNTGNWMLTPDGHAIPIDHGHAYMSIDMDTATFNPVNPTGPIHINGIGFVDNYIGGSNPLTKADVAEVRRRLEGLRPDFDHLGKAAWLDYSLRVLDTLEPDAGGFGNIIGGGAK